MHAVETQNLTKIYRSQFTKKAVPSLDALDLTIRENEIFGFLGRNGAGKTTTMKILCGLLRQTRGEARIGGIDVRKRAARHRLGYLPETPYYYEYLTPKETLDFYGRLNGLGAAERRREWDLLSELLDLRDLAEQRVRGFSKGLRQRLGFAVALVGDPEVLILDEPMSGLDPLGRRMIRELILLMRDQGKTIFFSSHILGDVEQICDRVGILDKGRLTDQGRLDELLTRQIEGVEIIARDIPESLARELEKEAVNARLSEDGHHFEIPDIKQANDAVRRILANGGNLLEFSPIKESLEDYFIRKRGTDEEH